MLVRHMSCQCGRHGMLKTKGQLFEFQMANLGNKFYSENVIHSLNYHPFKHTIQHIYITPYSADKFYVRPLKVWISRNDHSDDPYEDIT